MLNADELQAINAVLDALEPLDGDMKQRVMLFVLGRIGAEPSLTNTEGKQREKPPEDIPEGDRRVHDIRALKDAKSPRSAVEMAALVAYYLSELAPEGERKKEIQTADLERHFKQAQYPLPGVLAATLPRAAAAGYMELVSRGKYRLNPVGHNLVVHSLPAPAGKRGGARSRSAAPKRAKSPPAKARASKTKATKAPSSASASRRAK